MVTAYDILFGLTPQDAVDGSPVGTTDLLPPPVAPWGEAAWGWIGDGGPGIEPRTWPRSPSTGLPMRHAVTLRLPVEYQRRGPGFPGVAYFLGEGQFATAHDATDPDDPFVVDLRAAREHPQALVLRDIIGQSFALVWLTEQELAAGPTAAPADTRRPGEHVATDEGQNAWDPPLGTRRGEDMTVTRWAYLVPRADDPNAGVAPGREEDGWVSPWDEDWTGFPEGESPWADDHLGGTSEAMVDSLPGGFTPYYLELSTPTWGVDYGNRETHLVDLESGAFGIA
ncbi:hypothetical protein [Cellulosimicrobium cellulans]|uniref:hypothetical protein n=1 Tax=Cellulosimicrobium cellulans TaxID=1710 RepID=UPI0028AA8C8A|nr:hypothetical protein [Cellulosimicrobium cellulans]